MYDDKPIRPDCLDQPSQEWRDERPSIGKICRATADRYIDGNDEERRALRRELDEDAATMRQWENESLTEWLWPGNRLIVDRPAIWLGDPDHDPR